MRKGEMRQWIAYTLVLVSLLSGVLIYALFRHDFGYLTADVNGTCQTTLSKWIVYSLPDALWMFSLSLLILAIWDFKLSRGALSWFFTAGLVGIALELLQSAGIIPGTFDHHDLFATAIAAMLPLLFIVNLNNKNIPKKSRDMSIQSRLSYHKTLNQTMQ